MIYTDCEDQAILSQIIESCNTSKSRAFITDSLAVNRVATDNLHLFRVYYFTSLPHECKIELI